MQKSSQILVAIISILAIVSITLAFHYVKTKILPADYSQNQTGESQTPVPEIVKQLYTAEIPRDFDLDNEKVSLSNGKIEIRGPQIEADGSMSKEFPNVFHWGAYLFDESNAYVVTDVNNDGFDDVAIVMGETGGGSGFFYHLVLFLSENGQLNFKTSQYLGDRIKINNVTFEKGIFSVVLVTQGPDEGYCCGTLQKVFKYKYLNGVFTGVTS